MTAKNMYVLFSYLSLCLEHSIIYIYQHSPVVRLLIGPLIILLVVISFPDSSDSSATGIIRSCEPSGAAGPGFQRKGNKPFVAFRLIMAG